MWELNREYAIEEIKKMAMRNLKEMRYITDVYCNFPDTHFSTFDLEALVKGKKVVRTNGLLNRRCFTYKNLEEFGNKDLYELLIMIKQDEVNIMKYKIKYFDED